MRSTPKKLKPFIESYKIQRKMRDEEQWMQGQYFFKALNVSLSHFASKNSNEKYFEKPILQENEEVADGSREVCAVIEMKQRSQYLEKQGLSQSPL